MSLWAYARDYVRVEKKNRSAYLFLQTTIYILIYKKKLIDIRSAV